MKKTVIIIRRFELPMWRLTPNYHKYEDILFFLRKGVRSGLYAFYYMAINTYLTLPNIGVANADFDELLNEALCYNYDLFMDAQKAEPDITHDYYLQLLANSFASDLRDLFKEFIPAENCMFRNLVWTLDNRFYIDIEVY